jgi:hypothetical protein
MLFDGIQPYRKQLYRPDLYWFVAGTTQLLKPYGRERLKLTWHVKIKFHRPIHNRWGPRESPECLWKLKYKKEYSCSTDDLSPLGSFAMIGDFVRNVFDMMRGEGIKPDRESRNLGQLDGLPDDPESEEEGESVPEAGPSRESESDTDPFEISSDSD